MRIHRMACAITLTGTLLWACAPAAFAAAGPVAIIPASAPQGGQVSLTMTGCPTTGTLEPVAVSSAFTTDATLTAVAGEPGEVSGTATISTTAATGTTDVTLYCDLNDLQTAALQGSGSLTVTAASGSPSSSSSSSASSSTSASATASRTASPTPTVTVTQTTTVPPSATSTITVTPSGGAATGDGGSQPGGLLPTVIGAAVAAALALTGLFLVRRRTHARHR